MWPFKRKTDRANKDKIKKNNEFELGKLQNDIAELEKLIPDIERNPYNVNSELPIKIMDSIYSSAIFSFVNSLEEAYHTYNQIEEEGFKQLEPVLSRWKEIQENKYIDEQLFEDFRNDLQDFTNKYPDWSDDEWKMNSFFEEKCWKPYFQHLEGQARDVSNRIQAIFEKSDSKIELLIKSEYALITPFEFEELVAELFEKMGYKAGVTSKTGDYGVDIVAKENNDIIAIQAKKYAKGNNVGNRDVQRLLGAMQLKSIKANKAILVTTSDYTVQAKEQAKETPIELWNGDYLNSLMIKYM